MSDSLLLSATQRLSTLVASRTSRRSFIGRATGVALVAAAGSAAMPEDASAAFPCDCAGGPCMTGCPDRSIHCDVGGHSVSCRGLTGFGGHCPPNTQPCGQWACGCGSCSSGTMLWTDCCAVANQCAPASSCLCVPDLDGRTRPTCCYGHCYKTSTFTGCHMIVCRFELCAKS